MPVNQKQQTTKKITEALALLDEAAEEKREEIKELVNDNFKNVRGLVSEIPPRLRESAQQSAKHAQRMVEEFGESAVQKGRELGDHVDKEVHERPWTYIAGAAAGTFIAGYFLGRK